jgi:hypothetical protein
LANALHPLSENPLRLKIPTRRSGAFAFLCTPALYCGGTLAIVNSPHRCDDPTMNDLPARAWRDLAADWRVWVSLLLCLLIATLAWLLGYD